MKTNLIKYIALIMEIILWLVTFVYTYEYFIHTDKNRYKFKYWAIISVLSILQILLIMFYNTVHIKECLIAINFLYILIAINLFEIFVYMSQKKIGRKKEIFLRTLFLTLLICYNINNDLIFLILSIFIIIYLSLIVKNYNFLVSHMLYCVYIALLSKVSYSDIHYIIVGFIYTFNLMLCIRKMYILEHIEEVILKEE